MTLFMRSLFLGYSLAISAAIWLSASGISLWAAILVAWIGGNILGLSFAALGSWIAPDAAAEATTSSDYQLWDEDLAQELINADLFRDAAPAPASTGRLREVG